MLYLLVSILKIVYLLVYILIILYLLISILKILTPAKVSTTAPSILPGPPVGSESFRTWCLNVYANILNIYNVFANILHVETSKTFLFDFPLNRIHIVSNLPWCRFFEVPTRKRYNTCLENSSQQIFQRFLELAEQWRDTCSEILCQQQIPRERISKVIQKSIIFYGLGAITLELDIFDMKALPSQYCFKGSIPAIS